MTKLFIDVECCRNYFLIAALDDATGNVYLFDAMDDNPISHKNDLRRFMNDYMTIGFNSLSYDLPLIKSALAGHTTRQLYLQSCDIISAGKPSYSNDASDWDHVDLIQVAPGQSGLKVYGGRLHAEKLQDLPIEPDAVITPERADETKHYCVNDLRLTQRLYRSLEKAIDLRSAMSKQYGMGLRSKADAQIAEAVIRSELEKKTGRKYRKPDKVNTEFKYNDPKLFEFHTDELKTLFGIILDEPFEVNGSTGNLQLPETLKKRITKIADKGYKVGIGGLHSMEKKQCVRSDDEYAVIDMDVASYYPSIILQQRLAPKSLGEPFLAVYESIVSRRLLAKNTGNKVEADSLKIVINASFGKMGSKYSFMYSPDLMLQVTITGQLALLMLIERMVAVDIEVMSANTDGIVVKCRRDKLDVLDEVAWDWQMDTAYLLERTPYRLIASRDVNNYFAITESGKVKGKGLFADDSLMKNPDQQIIPDAVKAYALTGTPIDETITSCTDIRKFLTLRSVTGGALWHDELVGKVTRFYGSNDFQNAAPLRYKNNGNKVPKSEGSMLCMNLPDQLPSDIDYPRYIEAANKLKAEVGL